MKKKNQQQQKGNLKHNMKYGIENIATVNSRLMIRVYLFNLHVSIKK